MYDDFYELWDEIHSAGGDDTIISARVLTADADKVVSGEDFVGALIKGANFLHGSYVLFAEEYGWASVEGTVWVYHPPRPR